MKYIEQGINVLYEDKIDYQKIDKLNKKDENIKINNLDEFYDRNKFNNKLSIITGNNGIGKSYLLEKIREKFDSDKRNVILLKFKDYDKIDTIKSLISEDIEILLLDGLDEININILNEVLEYIFSIDNKKVIVSSRKDFLLKNNLLNIKYNIYEIKPLTEYKIDEILSENNVDKEKFKSIYPLLKMPRFLIHLIKVKDEINDKKNINKYDLLEMIVNKHFDVLNARANIKLQINIHKKILQSMALVMMMTGKINLTIEEFVVFLSKTNYLDVKSYVLNKDIIESFLNNQLLMNYGNLIMFENKEIMEFLAAKEIYENGFSNQDLFEIVSDENSKELNTLWFNTLTYLIYKSEIYNELILNYVFNNFQVQENLLDFILNIDFNFVNKIFIIENMENIIFQYTKLYQYMPFYGNLDNIAKILSCSPTECMRSLTNILFKYKLNSKLEDFDIIYINNVLSCIHYLVENIKFKDDTLANLREYLSKNEEYYMNSESFSVRYLSIYINLFEYEEINNVIDNNNIRIRLLSLFLHEAKDLNKLNNLDKPINKYVLNCKNRFSDFVINESIIIKFINENYDSNRLKELLNNIKDDNNIASFIHFLNSNQCEELWHKFDEKSIVNILYDKIVNPLFEDIETSRKDIIEEIFFDRRKGDALEKILSLCIKYQYICLDDLNKKTSERNYIVEYLLQIIIKLFMLDCNNLSEIYNKLDNKNLIFLVWKLDLSDEVKDKLEGEIKSYFPQELAQYKKTINEYMNKDFVRTENLLSKINSAKNIYFKIEKLYNLIKNEQLMNIINSNVIFKNTFKALVREIDLYVKNINIDQIYIKINDNHTYTMSYDFDLYFSAIFILFKMGYNINDYNNTNIILLRNFEEEIKPVYKNEDYENLLSYVKKENSDGYIKLYLYDIIYKLKNKYSQELLRNMFVWLENIKFEEYEINQILSFICDNIKYLNEKDINKLSNFKENKICQDLFIQFGVKSEIENRIKYIKENLVFAGDSISIERNGNFEYSSGGYITPLSKIGIEHKEYICDLILFVFKIYNTDNYYCFSKYVLEMVTKYINNNLNNPEINDIIELIVTKEKNNNNRYLYDMCKKISTLKNIKNNQISEVINKYNIIMNSPKNKIYSYDDLFNLVKEILEQNVFNDILRMGFLEMFRDKKTLELYPLKEEIYQFIIGYELSRILNMRGFSTKVVFETTAYDKKRGDIQLVSEGFIENIIIETKLTNNSDILNETSIKEYINNTLEIYKNRFHSPKILFVLINQTLQEKTYQNKVKLINKNNDGFVTTIVINLKKYFKKKNKK